MSPLPHQTEGAVFLLNRSRALLADAPRVGKTGAAITAADMILPRRTLVVTTASGRPVWARGFADWSAFDLSLEVVYGKPKPGQLDAERVIVSWSDIAKLAPELVKREWDLLILDESHYAKSIEAKRTQAVFGEFRGEFRTGGIAEKASVVWCLTGTPIPNAPNDLYPMMRALAPERLGEFTRYDDFLHRYCVVRVKRPNRWTKINVVVAGRNEAELRDRLTGFWLRRTQADVGITSPIYDILPVHISDKQRRDIEAACPEAADVLAAAETGETGSLEMHLGTLRRVTGTAKADGVAQAVLDEFDSGLDRIVLMCWHRDVMDRLEAALSKHCVVRVDGSTSADNREKAMQAFQSGHARVFIGQIVACGEAIDLSAAAELIFVESSFVPKDMAQAALRITNHGQRRQPRVRVAALEGSVDEALQAILLRKVKTNKEVMM